MADHHPTPADHMSTKRVPVHPGAPNAGVPVAGKAPAPAGPAIPASGKVSITASGKAPVHTSAMAPAQGPGPLHGPGQADPLPGSGKAPGQGSGKAPVQGSAQGVPASGQASVPVRRVPTNAVPAPAFVLQPMIHVTDMGASVAFYEQLGGSVIHGGRDADWVLMQLGTTQIALVARPPRHAEGESTVELNFLCTVPLDRLAQQLHGSGTAVPKLVTDRTFGHQLHVQSPDGLLIRINEVDPDPLV